MLISRNTSGLLGHHQHSADCNVLYDSKNKESSHMSREQCLSQEFKSSDRFGDSDVPFPFYVVSYPFKDYNQVDSHFTGIDLRYQFGTFSHLNFRIKNTNKHDAAPQYRPSTLVNLKAGPKSYMDFCGGIQCRRIPKVIIYN